MNKLLVLLIFLILTSCSSIFNKRTIKRLGVLDEKCKINIIKNKKQEIIFILMHHIGRKEYYADIAKKIDSLQKLNYTVFYEGAISDKGKDSLLWKKNAKKLRKLMNFFPQGGYVDTTTNKLFGRINYNGKYKLVNQPKKSKLNIDSQKSIKADVTLNELMKEFEKTNPEIKLDDCDLRFSLDDKDYNCKKAKKNLRKKFERKYILDYRNKFLAKKIINSKKNKVLVVYGRAHFYGLYFELILLDKSYRISKI